MKRPLLASLAFVACTVGLLPAATLERLSMDDLVQKSTDIVRGRVSSSSVSLRASSGRHAMIYTHYKVQVLERWKGASASQMDVAVPGGAIQNFSQTFPGAPTLTQNAEYVFFLWTSPSGLTQIIGLSQGLFGERADASGATFVVRVPSSEQMLDSAGRPVADSGLTMSLAAFRNTLSGYGLVDK